MKNFTLFFIALCSCIGLTAQNSEYVPLVREGVEWGYANIENSFYGDLVGYSSHRIRLEGDELIGGKIYKKCYSYEACTFDKENAFVIGWMREENKKVYFLYNSKINTQEYSKIKGIPLQYDSNTEEKMIYDFTPEKTGDKVNLFLFNSPEDFVVNKIEYTEINGSLRKMITLDNGFGVYITIAEGIGVFESGHGDLIFPYMPVPSCICNKFNTHLNYIRTDGGLFEYKNSNLPKEFKDCTASVDEINDGNIKISRTSDGISINFNEPGYYMAELVDAAGHNVFKKLINDYLATIPTTGYSPGIYILTIQSDNGITSQKVMIK